MPRSLSTCTLLFFLLATSAPQVLCGTPRVAQAWYPGWHGKAFTPANVSWNKYTHMTYAFAELAIFSVPSADLKALNMSGSGPDIFPNWVKTAKANKVKALVSIGGWTGSIYWSNAVAPANRTKFIQTVTQFASSNKLDGLDFDWEYPASQGIGCNTINANDTANFIAFLEELRKDPIGKNLILTAATPITPYNDASGNPSINLSRFANALNYVALMDYDIWGPWVSPPLVGPNGPLDDLCADKANQQGSAVSAVVAWKKAGIPYEKMLLGVPAYGHSYSVKKADPFVNGTQAKGLAAYPKFDANVHPTGDRWDDPAGKDVCGNMNPAGGIFNFWGLIENGFLYPNGSARLPYRFDNCSKASFVYNASSEVMVAYDSVDSFNAKGKYIASKGLAGFAIWQAGGDYKDLLLDGIRKGAGM
ncbi:hypothetical protein V5O48_015607 [Marasmius crinis-equi]|uniref:GH18 domain-containing protein n=1 Tax=Marasmius crinis-equi TaxID=585013 RepID=A0ABR3EU24_9AGAR